MSSASSLDVQCTRLVSTLGEKGSTTINLARNDTIPFLHVPVQKIHQECRRIYCKPDQIAIAAKQGYDTIVDTGRHVHVLRSAEKLLNLILIVSHTVNQQRLQKQESSDVFQVNMVETKEKSCSVP